MPVAALGTLCANGPDLTVMSVTYTEDSAFHISLSNVPTTGYCSLDVTRWNGAAVTDVRQAGTCDSFSPMAFQQVDVPDSSIIQYGKTFEFSLKVYNDVDFSDLSCTNSISVTPSHCRAVNYGLSALSLIKRPYGDIRVLLTNKPMSGECYYYFDEWNSSPAIYFFHDQMCTGQILDLGNALAGGGFTARMVNFAPGADLTSEQPLCGISAVHLVAALCDSGFTVTDTASNAVTVTITTPQRGRFCEVYLHTWNDIDVRSFGFMKVSPDCSSVVFTGEEVGSPLVLGGGQYAFEVAQYEGSDRRSSFSNPVCSSAVVSSSLTSVSCDASSLNVVRPDPNTMRVIIDPAVAKPYGVCRVQLVKYAGASVSISRIGPCTMPFDFISDGTSITYASGESVVHQFQFFPTGNLADGSSCASGVTGQATHDFECSTIPPIVQLVDGAYIVQVPDPRPVVGSCGLRISNAGGPGGLQSFASCSSTMRISYSDLETIMGAPQQSVPLTFQWTYTDPSAIQSCDGAGQTTGQHTMLDYVSIVLVSSASGSITLTTGDLPSTLVATGALGCKIELLDCNAIFPSNPYVVDGSTCDPSNTYVFNNPDPITPGASCRFVLYAYVSGSPTAVLAQSDTFTAVAAGVPLWGDSQSVAMSMHGSDCMRLAWEHPAESNGSPVLCYAVLRKDGTGQYITIAECVPSLEYIVCGFTVGVAFQFQIIAINHVGPSAADGSCVSQVSHIEYEMAAPDSDYLSPVSSVFVAGGFPAITVQENNPTSPLGGLDTVTTGRVFVARLFPRCKLDPDSLSVALAIESDEENYSPTLPFPLHTVPLFTQVLTPVPAAPGVYYYLTDSISTAGAYSLAVHSLESGGLLGHYWSNIGLTGVPAHSQKDAIIDFQWENNEPIFDTYTDLVSVRWTGFIEPEFGELYTLVLESQDYVRLWLDEVLVLDMWDETGPCDGQCFVQVHLDHSVPGPGSRRFHHIRIEFFHTKGIGHYKAPGITFAWSSPSQVRETVPAHRLFKAPVIQSAFHDTTIISDVYSIGRTIVTYPPDGSVIAGEYSAVNITARDIYGNVLSTSDQVFIMNTNSRSVGVSVPVGSSTGLYTIRFKFDSQNSYSVEIDDQDNNPVSSSYINVVGAAAVTVYTTLPLGSYAGVPITMPLVFNDAGGNSITVDPSASPDSLPPVYVRAEWLRDPVAASILTIDDPDTRVAKFGSVFTNATISYSGGGYVARMTLPLAGVFNLYLGIEGSTGDVLEYEIGVAGNVASYGPNAVVLGSVFPPVDLTVGQMSTLSVHLRDVYGNVVNDWPPGGVGNPNVVVRLSSATGFFEFSCTPNMLVTPGEFLCEYTPAYAGTAIQLSVLVDGSHASHLYVGDDDTVHLSRSPWTVKVAAGWSDATSSYLTNLRSVYAAGTTAEVRVYLRDTALNPPGDQGQYQTVTANYVDWEFNQVLIDAATFHPHYDEGYILIPIPWITPTSPGQTYSLQVYVNSGGPVPLPFGFPGITVLTGPVNASMSLCGTWYDTEVGAENAVVCQPRDAVDNTVVTTSMLYFYTNFSFITSPGLVPPFIIVGSKFGDAYGLATTSSSLTTAGIYSVITRLGQPGGLLAAYYSDAQFSKLIVLDTDEAPRASPGHLGEANVYYTQIDRFVSISFPSEMTLSGSLVRSVRWTGLLTASTSASYTVFASSIGGMLVRVNENPSPQVDNLDGSSTDANFVVTLAADTPVPIVIEYVVGSSTDVNLKWILTSLRPADPFVIPPSALLAPLPVKNQEEAYQITLSLSPVSTASIATFSDSVTANATEIVIVQAKDSYGNAYTADPTDCVGGSGGSVPTCLFFATVTPDDGTMFGTPIAMGDGTIKFPVTFLTDGPKQVSIKLQTSSGVYEDISGSPYSVDVLLSPR